MTEPVLPVDTIRFKYHGKVYSEERFLQSIIDSIVSQSQYHTYELAKVENSSLYQLQMKVGDKNTAVFLIDPRYMYGLGIPMIQVPVTNGLGKAEFNWAPLGMGKKLNNAIFSEFPMTNISVPISEMIPAASIIQAQRALWPDTSLYDEVDMSNLVIPNGKDYQDFGYYLYQVLRSVEAKTGIKGRFRPAYKNPNHFVLYSDRNVNKMRLIGDDTPVQALDVAIEFDGKEITIKSLVNNGEQKIPFQEYAYPNMDNVIPPVFGEDPSKLMKFDNAVMAPKPLSQFEKIWQKNAINLQNQSSQQPVQQTAPTEQIKSPLLADTPVDISAEVDKLVYSDGGLKNLINVPTM